MTFRTPGLGRRAGTGRRGTALPVLVALTVLVAAYLVFTAIWTDLLWYRSIGTPAARFGSVYTTRLRAQAVLFAGAGLLMALVVGANMVIAYRLRPVYRPLSVEQRGLDRYRALIEPRRRLVTGGALLLLGLLTGSSVAGRWPVWLAFLHRTPFGVEDPEFHKDVSFYVFTYPFLRLLLGVVFATVILSLVAAVMVHYLYGGLQIQGPGEKASLPARAHLSVLVGLFVLLKAFAYWFDRYGLVHSERGVTTGASYTDVNALLPAKTILAVIALICAVLFFVNIVRRGMVLPGAGLTLLVLSAVLVGGVYPLLIQQFQVRPDEQAKERAFIQRNIDATRAAYGVQDVKPEPYGSAAETDGTRLAAQRDTLSGVRLLDPAVVGPTFQQLQQIREFYRFPDTLDVDRYGGQDSVVAVRELSGAPRDQKGWVKDHLIYTHGYGFVRAAGDQLDGGKPAFKQQDMPQEGTPALARPQVYFGERSAQYSIVGGRGQRELDYPDQDLAAGQADHTYTGTGGVPIDTAFHKLLYATRFQDKNLLLSGAIKKDARILYDRTPRQMVQRAAPWLTLDGNPYPVAVGGRILWVVDGYTTSSGYPYAETVGLKDATRDTVTDTRSAVARQSDQRINYLRNAVKATVDAYDGTVHLYQWDEADPVARTWMKVFKGTVEPKSAIPPELLAHLRYPEDLFKVQRRILARYHVTQADSFYNGQGFWDVPEDPNPVNRGKIQPPAYLSLRMPEPDGAPRFSLTSSFTPPRQGYLAAFLAADSAPVDAAGKPNPDYGRLRLLEMTTTEKAAVPRPQGPGQVQNAFESDPEIKNLLYPTRNSGTVTKLGNLLTLPFAGGLLYVEPVFTQSSQGNQQPYPTLQHVLVKYNNDVASGKDLTTALDQLFAITGKPATAAGGGSLTARTQQAVKELQQAFTDYEAAQKRGDYPAMGEAWARLRKAKDALAALQQQAPAAAPAPGATPAPSPSGSPSSSPSPG
ncbi:UPF0182 family membrane protein [Actinomadura parmotrematis]|uniref:UPF0182 protein K1Y72_28305 n=1 Tax=Actinomadura parmotrematis TaxID=2864039 RepID=A0ABS7G182_9ACTN|nr:UPF0182 family protein [Actinomadura parmotrematis]MBW8486301.1 UPF0182 family protein [Actinomadura parmotrematis]